MTMEISGEFVLSLTTTVTAVIVILGSLLRLERRVSDVSDRVSRIEGLLEGYFLQASKMEQE